MAAFANVKAPWLIKGAHLGPLHMSPVDRAGSSTEMKLVSVHMMTFSPLSEMKKL